MRAFAGFAVFAFLITSPAAADQVPATPASGNVQQGKELYLKYNCYACHGTEGHGGAGPRIIARATPDSLIRYVRKPTGGNMPPYTSTVISEQELRDIHAYLRSVPPSPPAKSIPLLQQ
jgi:mono/diheme cytochrome c family protein